MSGQELMTVHEKVLDAARRGVPAVFASPAEPDGPRGNGEQAGGAGSPPPLAGYDDESAWADRTVDGGWLAALLSDGDTRLHPHGLVIQGARIVGGLDLEGVHLTSGLRLVDCQFGEHMVVLREARTGTVDLSGSQCRGVDADRAHIGGSFRLDGAVVDGPVRLVDAHVEASVACDGTRIEARGAVVLDAARLRVGGSILLRDGFTATGEVRLSRSTVGGDLNAAGATLHNPDGAGMPASGDESNPGGAVGRFDRRAHTALRANGAEVAGTISLRHGFTAQGEIQMFGVRVGGDVVCTEARLDNGDGDALSLDGAHIGGGVFLRDMVATGRVRLVNSEIGGDLRGGGARLEHPSDMALYASRANITGNVFLDGGFVSRGQVRLSGASIGGRLRCGSASMSDLNPGGAALDANTARVGGEVHLDNGFTAVGQVRLASATIGAGLDCRGARIEAGESTGPTFDMRGARVATNVLFMKCEVQGTVRFTGATVPGDLNCRGARIANPDHIALHGSGSQVGGTIFLTSGFVAEGEVRLLGISIGRDLVATDARITSTERNAIGLTRARITGDVLLGEGLAVTGRVQMARAAIGGNVDCTGGTFTGRHGAAIDAVHAQVGGAVVLDDSTTITGELDLWGISLSGSLDLGGARITNRDGRQRAIGAVNARIAGGVYIRGAITGRVELRGTSVGGDLDCGEAHLVATDERPALAADRAQVGGSLLLNRGFVAEGSVRIRSSAIGGHASCRDGRFINPGGTALALSGSRVAGDLVLTGSFRAEGRTRLPGTTIEGDLDCTGGHFVGDAGEPALFAAGARIAGVLRLDGGFRASGAVVLQGASVATLQDDADSWPPAIDLDGFRYERLVCPSADRGWRARREWLRRQTTPSAQGYVQLSAVYRAGGDELDARRTLIERHNALLHPPPQWRAQLPSGPWELLRRAWRWVLRLTIGHGFAPGRSLLIALPLVLGLAWWLDHARDTDMLLPTDDTAVTMATADGDDVPRSSVCDGRYPCVQPVVYALDNMVPILELGQRSRWTPDQSERGDTWLDDGRWLAAAAWTTSAMGWVLATLVAASFTQIVRRE